MSFLSVGRLNINRQLNKSLQSLIRHAFGVPPSPSGKAFYLADGNYFNLRLTDEG